MNIGCSSLGLTAPQFLAQGIADIVGAGFQDISLDIPQCCILEELKYRGKSPHNHASPNPRTARVMENSATLGDCFSAMLKKCREKNLNIPISREAFLPWNTRRGDISELLTQINESANIKSRGICLVNRDRQWKVPPA